MGLKTNGQMRCLNRCVYKNTNDAESFRTVITKREYYIEVSAVLIKKGNDIGVELAKITVFKVLHVN